MTEFGYDDKNMRYLKMLSRNWPTIQSVCTEIINLRALLNLSLEAVEAVERDVITEAKAREREDQDALRTRMQKVHFCVCDRLGERASLLD